MCISKFVDLSARRDRGAGRRRRITSDKKKRVYLVLRVRRACNHRGTAKRPSTPSHFASRRSIFFSPCSLASCRGTLLSWGPSAPSRSLSLFHLLFFSSSRRFAASCRCAHSIIIIGFRSRAAYTAPLFSFPFFLFHLFLSPFVCARCSRIPLRSITNKRTSFATSIREEIRTRIYYENNAHD